VASEYRKHLVEAAFVVLGVVLALLANEWRQTRADKARAESARQSIIAELQANLETVNDAYTYHSHLGRELTLHLSNKTEKQLGIRLFSKGFIHPANTFRTAWEAARSTGALRHMVYEDVLLFSRTYALQERYERQQDMAGNAIYRKIMEGGVYHVMQQPVALRDMVNSLSYKEEELASTYTDALKQLKQKN